MDDGDKGSSRLENCSSSCGCLIVGLLVLGLGIMASQDGLVATAPVAGCVAVILVMLTALGGAIRKLFQRKD